MPDTTIVNTPAAQDTGAAGWAVALVIVLAVAVGGFVWYRYYAYKAPVGNTTNNSINVNGAAGTPGGGAPAGASGAATVPTY